MGISSTSSSLTGVYSADQLAAAQAATSTTGTDSLGKESFLKLLTTQLQYQDPLNPMENSEFVAQLAQFSSLEQLQGLSDGMDQLYLVNMSMNNASMTNLIGKDVVATGDEFHYDGDGATQNLSFSADAAATSSTITISDSDGKVVYSGDMGMLTAGDGSWQWDGKDMNGQPCAAGDYTFSISASDANGTDVDVTEHLTGTVDGMDLSSGSPELTVDGVPLALSAILSLQQGDSP
jgi:flagellar basal-body rod modification protein FlgD